MQWGCPVIISDQTPWKNLKIKKLGYNIKLSDIEAFKSTVNHFPIMEASEYNKWSNSAYKFASELSEDKDMILKPKTSLQMSKTLVTGLGYIGSPIVELIQNNHDVIIIDNLSNSSIEVLKNIKSLTSVEPEFYNIDLKEKNSVYDFFKSKY